MKMTVEWLPGQSPVDMEARLRSALEDELLARLRAVGEWFAKKLQTDAQAQAAWTDRSGDARAGLQAFVESEQDAIIDIFFDWASATQCLLGKSAPVQRPLRDHLAHDSRQPRCAEK